MLILINTKYIITLLLAISWEPRGMQIRKPFSFYF